MPAGCCTAQTLSLTPKNLKKTVANPQERMSNCNGLIRDAALDPELATRLRAYFRYSKRSVTADIQDYKDLLDATTPALTNAVAAHMGAWLKDLTMFQLRDWDGRILLDPLTQEPRVNCTLKMIVDLAFAFEGEIYPPDELLLSPGEPFHKVRARGGGGGGGGGGAARREIGRASGRERV